MNRWLELRYKALHFGGKLLAGLGFGGLSALGTGLGRLVWWLVPGRRRLAIRNIRTHLHFPPEKAARVARQSFAHSMRSFLETLLTQQFGLDSPRLTFAQPDLYKQFLACPRPIVAASAHMGAWELMASILGELYQPPRPRLMVVRRYHDPAFQRFISEHREVRGATMVGHRTVAASVLRALRENGVVGFLVDHNAPSSEALYLPFLGEEAAVNMGPALLAVRAKALIWPVFLLRDEGNRYSLHLREPLDTALLEGSREEKVRQAALFYTQAVEDMIKSHPEQWFWLHNRWKQKSGQ